LHRKLDVLASLAPDVAIVLREEFEFARVASLAPFGQTIFRAEEYLLQVSPKSTSS
jgi:hypothetical protein